MNGWHTASYPGPQTLLIPTGFLRSENRGWQKKERLVEVQSENPIWLVSLRSHSRSRLIMTQFDSLGVLDGHGL